MTQIQDTAAEIYRLSKIASQDFAPISKPSAAPPRRTSAAELAQEVKAAKKEATRGLGLFDREGRRAAKAAAEQVAVAAAQARDEQALLDAAQEQARIDAWWDALLQGVPETVLATVNQAFSDNERPSAAVAFDGTEMSVLVIGPSLDEMPEKRFAETASGNPTLKAMTKTERNQLHLIAVVGHMIVTLKEGFAVVPTCDRIRLVMLQRSGAWHDVLVAGLFSREHIITTDWSSSSSMMSLDEAEDLRWNPVGRTQELRPLDLYADPDLQALVDIANSAEWVEDEEQG